MTEETELFKLLCCYSCLCFDNEKRLHRYYLQNEHLRTIFQEDSIVLCFICKRLAEHAEIFVKNVQNNQLLLEDFNKTTPSYKASKDKVQTSVTLTNGVLQTLEYIDHGDERDVPYSVVYRSKRDALVKDEVKEERDFIVVDFTEEDSNFCTGSDEIYVKEEDFPLQELLKIENEEGNELTNLKKRCKSGKIKRGLKKMKENGEEVGIQGRSLLTKYIEKIFITRKQCMEERANMAQDEKYLNSSYKCTDCIKGFSFKPSYDMHMKKHSESSGRYKCDICTQRMESKEKLLYHKRYHSARYRCKECGLTRINRVSIKDHYAVCHSQQLCIYNCPHCSKVYTRQISLRKHIGYAHKKKKRVLCPHCNKYYASSSVLKTHLMTKHPKEVSALEKDKKYSCLECQKSFMSPSLLKKHMIKHTNRREAYCVECDKSFKSIYILQHHLKTVASHVNYIELPYQCEHCDKKFAIRRDLERHINRVHLNIRPHKCDQCDKSYINQWSLSEHKRLIHEGYKRPLKFPCEMCDKVFDRFQILKSHVRTHTGERPYQCAKCPATFSQSSTLGTHVKLIHLKLTRDGKPKHGKA